VNEPPFDRREWQTINDLFHRALELPADERAAFVDQQCAGDSRLHDEVTSLLAAHGGAGEFMDRPAGDAAHLTAMFGEDPRVRVGTTIGHYRIDRVLGEGGMGVVYLAWDLRLGRAVAIKALAPRFTGDPSRRERLRREARAAAQLSHPAIATVFALEEFDDHLYIVSEYVAGETLRTELAKGALAIAEVVDIAAAMAGALAAAHDHGIVHRDLKPENVIRSASGQIKILDFGLARFSGPASSDMQLTDDGMLLGTPAYMAPEQLRGEPVDFRADQFALGVVLFELAAGAHPFASGNSASTVARILEARPANFGERRPAGAEPAMWAALDSVIARCLEKRPDDRFASTTDLAIAVERIRSGSPLASEHRRRVAQPPTLRWWVFHQAAVTAAYAGLVRVLMYVLLEDEQRPGDFALLAGAVIAVLVASTLRLHLWFTHRWYPAEWRTQHRRTSSWIRIADVAFAAVLLVTAALGFGAHRHIALLLIAAAVASFLASNVIEPATTRAAFGPR